MLTGEHNAPHCTDGGVVESGPGIEVMDSDGVETLDNRPKETSVGGTVTGVVTVESAAVDEDERGIGAEDDRVVLDDED
ncbi:hypothetical protein HBH56_008970 [Parastagonospora nodorum]|nr:hypothetical protein HBH56_008970 [Parastagonospora nodorum]KAH3935133.1 hypothetical protein HBH54_042260 [Parastagonospora nodorum]KAH3987869.1 hypothetical protein HBH52_032540 [Parastagonospora nodorum]KAH4001102.1 hypothetical protein HBI10_092690 [Parastagonospora nodorum]KAH4020277.1 hypothetical protein HBI09_183210 [Parastagonospora nodorum]